MNWKDLIAKGLRHFGLEIYNPVREKVIPTNYMCFDPDKKRVIPKDQANYDPLVFGRYNLTSQRIVPIGDTAPIPTGDLDKLMSEAQRYTRNHNNRLCRDRYELVLSELRPGTGICIDACTRTPREDVRNKVTEMGYQYQPIDLGGDGKVVRREDLTNLNFIDAEIDCIISLDTLEHIPDYEQAVREMYRVLKDDGMVIAHVPCYFFEKHEGEPIEPRMDGYGHIRYFSGRELLRTIDAAGFVILRANFNFDYGALLCVLTKHIAFKKTMLEKAS